MTSASALRCKTVTDAMRLIRARYPDVAIVGKVYGPWSVAYQMVGIESFLMDTILDPDKVRRYLDAFLPACIDSARAQFEAGADAVMWADHTTGDLCSAETYRDFLLEMHQRITQEIGGPGVFHCCGKTIDRVHLFANAGWDCFHFESQVDAREARVAAGERMSLFGNLNNPTLLYQGTPDDVYQACWDLMDAGVDGLAPEGSVPLITRNEPLQAIARAAADWSAAASRRRSVSWSKPEHGPGHGVGCLSGRPQKEASRRGLDGRPEATAGGRGGRRPRHRGRHHRGRPSTRASHRSTSWSP